jgi:hypothetical protein
LVWGCVLRLSDDIIWRNPGEEGGSMLFGGKDYDKRGEKKRENTKEKGVIRGKLKLKGWLTYM